MPPPTLDLRCDIQGRVGEASARDSPGLRPHPLAWTGVTSLLHRLFPEPTREGVEPDYRFTLANERTFLAWIRTSLALSAGGLGALHLIPNVLGSEVLGILLLGLALITAATAYRRWAMNETSMRLNQPLPPTRVPQLAAISAAVVAMAAAILFIFDL